MQNHIMLMTEEEKHTALVRLQSRHLTNTDVWKVVKYTWQYTTWVFREQIIILKK